MPSRTSSRSTPRAATTRRRLLVAAAAAPLAAIGGCATAPGDAGAPADFNRWSEDFAADWVRLSPELSTVLRYFPPEEQARLDALSSAPEEPLRTRRLALARQGLGALDGFLARPLAPDERVGALTLRWSLQRVLDEDRFRAHGFAFAQTFGVQVRYVSSFAETQPLRRAADLPAWMSRLRAMPARIGNALAQTRRSAGSGIVPPRFILERARLQVQQLLDAPLADEPALAALRRRLATIGDLDAGARTRAETEATQIIESAVRPAWRQALALFDELLPRSTADAGLWRLPEGAAAYAQALASQTTTQLSADEVHALGLREVARLETEIDQLLRRLGRTQGSVRERVAALSAELQPPAEPDPRPALLARYAAHVKDAERRAEALFNRRPRAPLEVRRVGPLTERSASAYYTTPAPDGSRPGTMWVPLPGPRFGVLSMRSLAVHEGVPGHHFQLALQQETTTLPRWRRLRVFGGGAAHAEGWALYAERLAIDEGWYEGDLHSHIGALDSQLFRARRLVVDTGLHARRWTREQAIAYGISASEVERYVVNPGQACAYMVGMLRILQLREQARASLGPHFSLPDFHDLVLTTGSVPLDVLGDVVQLWVRNGGKAA